MRRDSSYSSGGKTEDSLGRACVGPPRDDATAHRTWDHGRRSSSSSSSSLTHPLTHPPTPSLTHPPTPSLTHPPTHSPTHPPTQSLTHSQLDESVWLDPGTEYYFYTKCFTKAGVAALRRSNGFIYDPTPPLQGTAWIGDEGGTEQWVQATGGRVYVYMQNFVDPESAIQFFYVALGTCVDDPACVDDLVGFVQVQGVG